MKDFSILENTSLAGNHEIDRTAEEEKYSLF